MSYINNNSIYGMMNKNCEPIFNNNYYSFYKTKNKKKITVFNHILSNDEEEKYDEVNYMYMDNKPTIKGAYKLTNVLSFISHKLFMNLNRKENKELFETYRKFTKLGYNIVEYDSNNTDLKNDILQMIEKWRYADNGGMKYSWQEHAGIDKSFFDRYDKMEQYQKDKFQVLIFYLFNKETFIYECVGYSVIEREYNWLDNMPKFSYLIRKCLMNERNLTEFIDYITFKSLFEYCRFDLDGGIDFIVDWGSSSGGVLWYKTHKWRVHKLKDKWFYKIKKRRN